MTPLVWANFPLALLFLLAWSGLPLWMVLRHPDTAPDNGAACAYLAAKAALATGGAPETRHGHSLSSAERATAPAADLRAGPVSGDRRGGHQFTSAGKESL